MIPRMFRTAAWLFLGVLLLWVIPYLFLGMASAWLIYRVGIYPFISKKKRQVTQQAYARHWQSMSAAEKEAFIRRYGYSAYL